MIGMVADEWEVCRLPTLSWNAASQVFCFVALSCTSSSGVSTAWWFQYWHLVSCAGCISLHALAHLHLKPVEFFQGCAIRQICSILRFPPSPQLQPRSCR